jgi:ATP-dependent DNA ligase
MIPPPAPSAWVFEGSAVPTDWPFPPPIIPMEAEVADDLPEPPGWAYEPKWDGFRVIIWSASGDAAAGGGQASGSPDGPASDPHGGRPGPRLDSRNAKPLLRYFPEVGPALAQLPPGTVADGEIVVVLNGKLDFDALQNRIHPAESRIRLLAEDTPAQVALFDLLALRGDDLRSQPFSERRAELERLATESRWPTTKPEGLAAELDAGFGAVSWLLSPCTTDAEVARHWFHDFEPAGFDGIVAKALDQPYAEGRRKMIKVKHRRTVDCVVGGYRLHKDGKRVGSLLLGLYNPAGELHFIGHCSSFSDTEAAALLEALRSLQPQPGIDSTDGVLAGFGEHARHPGAESRWNGDRDVDFFPVRPVLVVEVSYDQLTGDRFRHATRFERWRPDKDPRDCSMDQVERPKGPALIEALRRARETSP